jgi:hypothetical protein
VLVLSYKVLCCRDLHDWFQGSQAPVSSSGSSEVAGRKSEDWDVGVWCLGAYKVAGNFRQELAAKHYVIRGNAVARLPPGGSSM